MLRGVRRARRWRRIAGILAIGFAVGFAGCGARATADRPDAPVPRWPPPPDLARIEYVDTIRVPEDAGIRGSLASRIWRRVVYGREVRGMARPYAVASTPDGTIVVADPDARSVHLFDVARSRYRRVTEVDGVPLASPIGVAADSRGRVYVADSGSARIHVLDRNGARLATWGEDAGLERPTGLAYDDARHVLWVADTTAHRIVGFDDDGRRTAVVGRRGSGDGEFNFPVAVSVDPGGSLFVSDSMNFRIQVFDGSGRFVRAFGRAGTRPGDFDKAKGVALDSSGHVYVVEGLHDVIQVFDADGRLLTVVGGTGAGPGEFCLPAGIHIDGADRILVADSANRRVQILRYLGDRAAPGSGS